MLKPTFEASLQRSRSLLLDPDLLELVAAAETPRASIARGASGAALAAIEIYRVVGDPELLDVAERWLALGMRQQQQAPAHAFFGGPELHGVHNGPAGTAWVNAIIANVTQDRTRRAEAIHELQRCWRVLPPHQRHLSIMAGVAGYAEACNNALDELNELSESERAVLLEIRDEACAELTARLRNPPAVGDDLGLAVGHAGALYALLGRDLPLTADLEARIIDHTRRMLDDGAPFWPQRVGDQRATSMRATWCNGAVGHLQLLLRAQRRLVDIPLAEALRSTVIAVATWGYSGSSLCCGRAGAVRVLQHYERMSGDALSDIIDEILQAPCTPIERSSVCLSPFIGEPSAALALGSMLDGRFRLPVGFRL